MSEVKRYELKDVIWREYHLVVDDEIMSTWHISYPIAFYWSKGHDNHRVVDSSNVVHCVPAPGPHILDDGRVAMCVLQWKKKDGIEPVAF